ncbi:hypothetical protein [Sphingobacterium deserti]|nr:hypothetical protein [Sphingobacterium deserti]
MKYWGLTFSEALWSVSYQNLIMLNMSVPQYDKDGNKIEPPAELTSKDLAARFKGRKKKDK